MEKMKEIVKMIFFITMFILMGVITNPIFFIPEFLKYITEEARMFLIISSFLNIKEGS